MEGGKFMGFFQEALSGLGVLGRGIGGGWENRGSLAGGTGDEEFLDGNGSLQMLVGSLVGDPKAALAQYFADRVPASDQAARRKAMQGLSVCSNPGSTGRTGDLTGRKGMSTEGTGMGHGLVLLFVRGRGRSIGFRVPPWG